MGRKFKTQPSYTPMSPNYLKFICKCGAALLSPLLLLSSRELTLLPSFFPKLQATGLTVLTDFSEDLQVKLLIS